MSIDFENISGIPTKMLEKHILLAYKGVFSRTVINSILTNGKNQLSILNIELSIRKRIYNIMVESLENIGRYQYGKEESESFKKTHSPLFILGRRESGFYITVGNLIYNNDIDPLKKRLEELKTLDREDLKKKYRATIKRSEIKENGGAGLGIIDMALKSNNKIEYSFTEIKEQTSYFILQINV